tara:strand:+ start:1818 stop:1949 length:132 start_codon:yes stop_codon:yes gene_type:complete
MTHNQVVAGSSLAGVDYKLGGQGNANASTDHFVVIVGSGERGF